VMHQRWHDLLFAHWPIPPEEVRALVPATLPLDTFEGRAWLGVVPFRMSNVRPRGIPPLPGVSAFPELNVRTYASLGGKPGVYFFSLDAASALAVAAARAFFHLPYFRAEMSLVEGEAPGAGPASGAPNGAEAARLGEIRYQSRRTHGGAPPAEFLGRYRPTGAPYSSQPGSLEHWLTERYCLYAVDPRGRVFRGDIHHLPWPLQPAELSLERNTMAQAAGFGPLPGAPLLHFARVLDVLIWPLSRAG
jgi:uncharacterized protein